MFRNVFPAALLFICLAFSAQAQVQVNFDPLHAPSLRYGVRVGGQVMGLHSPESPYQLWYNGQNTYVAQTGLWGGNAGVAAELDFGWLAVQPAVLYMQKGYRYNSSRTETIKGKEFQNSSFEKQRMHYVEVPLNAVLTVRGFQLLAGPYLSVGVGGHYWSRSSYPMGSEYSPDYHQYTYDVEGRVRFGKEPQNTYSSDYYQERRLDVGYNLGLGYRHHNWQIQPTYSRSLRGENRYTPIRNWSAQLNLTRFFGAGA